MTFSKTIRAGGVAETVSANFDLDAELRYQAAWALDRAGLLDRFDELKWSEKTKSGDYTQQFIWIP